MSNARHELIGALARIGASVGTLTVLGATAPLIAQAAPKVFFACYVPLTGTVYRIKESDVRPACTSTSHIEFSWTDGANAVRVTDAAGGDLSGVFSNASVVKLLGRALATAPPTAGQVLTFDGTAWTPTTPPGVSLPAATGDVSGTYPSLTVSGLQGRPVAATAPTTGQILGFNGTAWQPSAAPTGGGVTAHGALTGLLNDDHPQYLLSNGVRTTTNGFAVTGAFGSGAIPASGPGTRLMWYPGKAAFRAGLAANNGEWDDINVGQYSTAFGWGTRANGESSTAMGYSTVASGQYSTAMGASTLASGGASTAMGLGTTASGTNSTAMGYNTTASGFASTAMGQSASTNGMGGSFMYGDASTLIPVGNTAANQFLVRASGGLRFRTASDLSSGCDITAGNLSCTGTISSAGGSASGSSSTALGSGATATGIVSTAMGNGTTASGVHSTAMGSLTTATGTNSTAMGANTQASGSYSTAMGNQTISGGFASTTMGNETFASGDYSTAMGYFTSATGAYSTAMGTGSRTNGHLGSFVYSDNSDPLTPVSSTADNQFTVRAAGGFRFRTAPDLSTGCDLPAGSGTWSCTSSRLAKERFENLNGEDVLTKIARMPIQTWSYRTEPGHVRHVGPTAQDFRAAFGLGPSDEAISLVDIDGINLLGVQTLERRTRELERENAALRARLDRLEAALNRPDR